MSPLQFFVVCKESHIHYSETITDQSRPRLRHTCVFGALRILLMCPVKSNFMFRKFDF